MMNMHGERVFVTMQIGRSHFGPEKRVRAKCCCSCWHFWSDTTDIKYGFMSLSKIGLVKITCHESLHSSHVCMAAAAVDPLCCLHFQLLHNFRRQKAKVKLSSLDSSGHARVILGKNENFRLLSKVFNWRKRRENLLMSNQILVKRKDSIAQQHKNKY